MKKQTVVAAMAMLGAVALTGCEDLEASSKPGGSEAPMKVTAGKSFEVGKWQAKEGWSVTKGGFMGYNVKMNVTNTSDETDTVFYVVKLLKGTSVVASIDCNTAELEPKQSAKANCIGDGNGKAKYTSITVENTF